MPKGPRGEKRPADVIGAAIMVAKIATGEITEEPAKRIAKLKPTITDLAVGDIFHATAENDARLICLVTSITQMVIHARTVTTQYSLEFDRQSGIGQWGKGTSVIDSMAPLPPDIRDALLGLDQRYRRGDDPKLLDAEKKALLFVASFYPANPV